KRRTRPRKHRAGKLPPLATRSFFRRGGAFVIHTLLRVALHWVAWPVLRRRRSFVITDKQLSQCRDVADALEHVALHPRHLADQEAQQAGDGTEVVPGPIRVKRQHRTLSVSWRAQ